MGQLTVASESPGGGIQAQPTAEGEAGSGFLGRRRQAASEEAVWFIRTRLKCFHELY